MNTTQSWLFEYHPNHIKADNNKLQEALCLMGLAKLNQANSSPLINYVSIQFKIAKSWSCGSVSFNGFRPRNLCLTCLTSLKTFTCSWYSSEGNAFTISKKITKTFRWKVKEIHICCSIYNAKLRGLFTMGTIRWNYFSRKHFRNSEYILWLSDK